MSEQLVKKTTSGKFRIVIKASLKMFVREVLERFVNHESTNKITIASAEFIVYNALLNEVYLKHYTALHMANGETKLTLTKAQALAFWAMSQAYSNEVYNNPSMGGILLQLHQKLS